MRSPRVAVKDCRWRTASWMVFSFQFEVFLFSVLSSEHPPSYCPILGQWLSFLPPLFTCLCWFLFYFCGDSIRFDSIRVDGGFWPELGWLFSGSNSSSGFQHRRAHNCLARLTVCNWSLAASSSYQLTNLPTSQFGSGKAEARPEAWIYIWLLSASFSDSGSGAARLLGSLGSILQLIWRAGLAWESIWHTKRPAITVSGLSANTRELWSKNPRRASLVESSSGQLYCNSE